MKKTYINDIFDDKSEIIRFKGPLYINFIH